MDADGAALVFGETAMASGGGVGEGGFEFAEGRTKWNVAVGDEAGDRIGPSGEGECQHVSKATTKNAICCLVVGVVRETRVEHRFDVGAVGEVAGEGEGGVGGTAEAEIKSFQTAGGQPALEGAGDGAPSGEHVTDAVKGMAATAE